MKNPLKVAVIGVGHMGRNHARIYSELDGCELVAVIDKDLERAREIAAQYGGQAFSRFADVTAPIAAATVAVPTVHHAEVAIPLLDRGIAVLVEKPLAPDAVSARQLVEAAGKNGQTRLDAKRRAGDGPDWLELLDAAALLEISEAEFWNLTPAEFERAQWAYLRRREREDRRTIASAWYVATFSRQKRLTSLTTLLAPVRKVSDDERKKLDEEHARMIQRIGRG